jgi:hypothetical protein
LLIQNSARFDGGGAYGELGEPFYPCTLSNCIISSNRANEGYGGGTYYATLRNCTVTKNVAIEGGGAWAGVLHNCMLIGNEAGNGGGVAGQSGTALETSLDSCTLAGNRATGGLPGHGGAAAKDSWLYSCIVYENYSLLGGGSPNYTASCSLNYCCTAPMPAGIGNIAYDPLFVDPANGNFRLQSNSPCINSGPRSSTGIVNPTGIVDLDGNERFVGGTIDIGAYEFQSPTSVLSYAWAQQYGLPTDGSADYADSDNDGMNNWQEWTAGTSPTDSSSALRLLQPVQGVSGVTVTWQSVTNRTYLVERASSIGAQSPFSPIADNIVGQDGTTSYIDTNNFGSSTFFYRVRVE